MPVQGTAEQLEIERFLATAKVVAPPQASAAGRSDPWLVTLNDGRSTRRAIFKYIDRPGGPLLSVSYKREIAAYVLSKLFGIDIVPPVVERSIQNTPGSLQIMDEGCITEAQRQQKGIVPGDPRRFENAMDELRVFEHLSGTERPNLKDLLVHTDTWKVCRVDFSEGFVAKPELLPGPAVERCSRRLFERLGTVPDKALEDALRPYLRAPELEACLKRRTILVDRIRALIKEKGEAAVLF